jgi:hypothetical protein
MGWVRGNADRITRSRAAYAWRNVAIVRRNILSAMKLWGRFMIDLSEAHRRNIAARSAA